SDTDGRRPLGKAGRRINSTFPPPIDPPWPPVARRSSFLPTRRSKRRLRAARESTVGPAIRVPEPWPRFPDKNQSPNQRRKIYAPRPPASSPQPLHQTSHRPRNLSTLGQRLLQTFLAS